MPTISRRSLILYGLGGLALAAGRHYIFEATNQTPLAGAAQPSLKASRNISALETSETAGNALFQFVALGDVGTGDRDQYAVARAMSQQWQTSPFSTALLTGDNIYPNGEIKKIQDVFEKPYADLLSKGTRFYAALGNHDYRTRQGEDEIAYPGYNMSHRYYSFTQASVQFFALDTNQAHTNGEPNQTEAQTEAQIDEATGWAAQLSWLKQALKDSTAPWKVVFGHHPVYSSGHHGSHAKLQKDLPPLFQEYGVQLYLNGHDHNYERTEPINGTTYITTGNGAMLRSVDQSPWTAYSTAQLGFTAFKVYRHHMTIQAINKQLRLLDEAQIGLQTT